MNLANRNRAARILMEKTVGVHRDWVQPTYHSETVGRWWAKRGPAADVVRDHGRCRVVTDAGPGADAPRWHVLAAGL